MKKNKELITTITMEDFMDQRLQADYEREPQAPFLDSLTGLFNHGFFQRRVDSLFFASNSILWIKNLGEIPISTVGNRAASSKRRDIHEGRFIPARLFE